MKTSSDFDFILGKWIVKNRKLKKRLSNCSDWEEFEANFESRHILNGLGNMDEMKLQTTDFNFYGLSIRIYNPIKDLWTIHWADSHHPEIGLKPQVTGRFIDNIGTFYGEEMFQGNQMKLRFIWKSISPDHAFWNQAYYDIVKNNWEVNWTMDFWKINS